MEVLPAIAPPVVKRPKKLSHKQKLFLAEYLNNGQKGYAAYKKVTGTPLEGRRLKDCVRVFMRRPALKEALANIEKDVLAQIEVGAKQLSITRERVIEELAKIAFSDVKNVMEWNEDGVTPKPSADLDSSVSGAIAEVSEMRGAFGKTIRVKNMDKVGALVQLGKELGMFTEKVDHRVAVAAKFVIEK